MTRLLWLLCLPFALHAVLRITGVGTVFPLVQLLAFTPYVAATSVLPLGAALMTRRWWVAGAAGLVFVALLTCVAPRAVAGDPGRSDGPRLRVLTVNLRIGGADPAAIVELVHREHIDLLAVQEFTPDAERTLSAALTDLLPERVTYPDEAALGSALYSRFPLRDPGLRVHDSGFSQAHATVSVPGAGDVAVESVHPCAPVGPAANGCWGHDLADQPPATVDGAVRVLLGDFNATLDHAPLRRLIGTGYRDAADVRGAGFTATWPYDGKPIPGVALDHVLVDRRVGVAGYAVYPVPGTDHRAVYAELVLPPAA